MDINILFFGDIVGRPGRQALAENLPELKAKYNCNLVIVNGENSAGGRGVADVSLKELFSVGVDYITLGDHTFYQSEFDVYLNSNVSKVVRPANYPEPAAGAGFLVFNYHDCSIALINLIGRVSMNAVLDCPFKKFDEIFSSLPEGTINIVDFHAEATSEKYAMANYIDGRCSLLVGTHTHVQTADERIFEKGLAYITDLGMCGPKNGVIGLDTEVALYRFLTGRHKSYKLSKSNPGLNGVFVSIDSDTKRAHRIERISI